MHTKLTASALTLAAVLLTAGVGATAHENHTPPKPEHYTIALGIHGYSPVSYFEDGPEPGSPEFAATHDGVTYFFTDKKQLHAFRADPEKYVPAYGGWCAFGMAVEDHFPIDPESYKIVDGRLMLFLHNDEADALELWNAKDESEMADKADRFYRKVTRNRG